jgi:hypothetical protein
MGQERIVTALPARLFPVTEGKTSDEWYTPKWLFDLMAIRFDLDPASSPPELSVVPAARIFTVDDDGLSLPWEGRVWLNPPYSNPTPWVDRFLGHGHGVALLPSTSTGRWVDRMWTDCDGVVLCRPFAFTRGDDTVYPPAPFRSILWALGGDCVEAIGRVSRVRR